MGRSHEHCPVGNGQSRIEQNTGRLALLFAHFRPEATPFARWSAPEWQARRFLKGRDESNWAADWFQGTVFNSVSSPRKLSEGTNSEGRVFGTRSCSSDINSAAHARALYWLVKRIVGDGCLDLSHFTTLFIVLGDPSLVNDTSYLGKQVFTELKGA
jgi:hypothetical protein